MISKKKLKEAMIKENITTIDNANKFMDTLLDSLSDEKLKESYYGSLKKYDRKNNDSTKYVMEYIKAKCIKRGLKI